MILRIFSLHRDEAQATPADTGTTTNPTPVIDKIADVVAAPKVTTVSVDPNFDVSVLDFLNTLLIYDFYLRSRQTFL